MQITRTRLAIFILLPVLSVVVAIIAGATVQPDFRAQAKLLVPFGHEHMYRPIVGDSMTAPWKHEVAINAEREILNNLALKNDVVKRIGTHRILLLEEEEVAKSNSPLKEKVKALLRRWRLKGPRLSNLERGIRYMNEHLEVTSVKDSNVLHLSFTHKDRETSIRVLEVFLEMYLDQRSKFFAPPDLTTLETVLEQQSKRAEHVQRKLTRFKADHEIPDKVELQVLEEEMISSQRRLQKIREKIDDTRLERTLAEARWTQVRVLEPPYSPQTPISLPPLLRVTLAAALGLLLAILLILGLSNMPRRAS